MRHCVACRVERRDAYTTSEMKAPVEWLRAYVPIRLSPEALARRLTMGGLEVVGIEEVDGRPVLDLEITPNRADCLSIVGIAREIATLTRERLKPLAAQGAGRRAGGGGRTLGAKRIEPGASLQIRVEDRRGCPRYIGRLIAGVTVGSSPEWMQRRLIACGARPINTLVDITNYVLFEYGQPLHAFDFARLDDGVVVIRRARPREPITTLDGIARMLSPEMLVITDARRPIAVAGIMGGVGSEVVPQTTTVMLESAQFDPTMVRRTARTLGLLSESSYRFERGIDPEGVEAASARAAHLIVSLAGGAVTAVQELGAGRSTRRVIALDAGRLTRALGLAIPPAEIRTRLASLSCRVASGAGSRLAVTVPSFRRDLTEEVDLHEEIARRIGYERIPSTMPVAPLTVGIAEGTAQFKSVQALRELCAALGLTEVVNWALVSEQELARSAIAAPEAARLANPLSHDHAFLRPSLRVGLLQVIRRNLSQGAAGLRIFELARVVDPGTADRHAGPQASESWRLGVALCGPWERDWQGTRLSDFFRLTGLLEAIARGAHAGRLSIQPAEAPWSEPGQAGRVFLQEREIGVAGQVRRDLVSAWDIEADVWIAELDVEPLRVRPMALPVRSPTPFPAVKRDLSLVVRLDVPFAVVQETIRQAAGRMADRVELIDRYTGRQIPDGKQGFTFSIEYRDPTRTLTAEEADLVHQRVIQRLAEVCQATLR